MALKKCRKKHVSYEDRLKIFNLSTLEFRRKINDLTMFYKLIHNQTIIPADELIEFSNRTSRRHKWQIKMKHKSNLSAKSFINRCTNEWNILDAKTVEALNVQQFKKRLNETLTKRTFL
jgi:hypothetical protein